MSRESEKAREVLCALEEQAATLSTPSYTRFS